jgi:SAM-dependent methyltransferase
VTADADEVRAATIAMAGHLRSAMTILMVDLGHRLGLFEALAAGGSATPADLATRAGCDERNVAEWLGAVTTGGIVVLDVAAGTYALPDAWAAVLTGDGPRNLAPQAATVAALAPVLPQVVDAVRHGKGVGYEAYRPAFTSSMDAGSRALYDHVLIDGHLAVAPGLRERLAAAPSRVLDVGCGTGHAANLIGQAFPAAAVLGIDLGPDAIAAGRAEAAAMGLGNVRFEVLDALALATEPPWDLITAFDAVHDQVDPAGLLRRIRAGLASGGIFLMVDIKAATGVEHNLTHPMGPWLYGISTLHCLQVSLAGGGPGLGTCWGRELAVAMLRDAGFGTVDVFKVDADRANLVYVCRS